MEQKTTAKKLIMHGCKRGFCKGKFSVLTSGRSWPPLWLHLSSEEDGTPAKPTADVFPPCSRVVLVVRCSSAFLLQAVVLSAPLRGSNENGNHFTGRAPC